MVSVDYRHEFGYLPAGRHHFPGLPIRIQNPDLPDKAIDAQAHLDSGARYSLFAGWIAREIGLDLLSGGQRFYVSTTGDSIAARVHRVVVLHDPLGSFTLDIGFSLTHISRNLLARDFFDLVQIGFREHDLAFYVTPSP